MEDSESGAETVSNVNAINISLVFVSAKIKNSMDSIEIKFSSLTSITNRGEDAVNVRSLSLSIGEFLRGNYSSLRLFSLDNYDNV